jgi:hypothetical protein
MALRTGVIEDKMLHDKPRVIRGWGLPYPRSINEVFWEEWLYRRGSRFHPTIQIRFISPDFPSKSKESLKDFEESVLRVLLSSATRDIDRVCREYVEKISKIEAVREILVVEGEKVTTVWTIIKAPPFEDSVREPIYTAQLQILRSLERYIPIDFYILNESELSSDKNLSDIIPSDARSIWQR